MLFSHIKNSARCYYPNYTGVSLSKLIMKLMVFFLFIIYIFLALQIPELAKGERWMGVSIFLTCTLTPVILYYVWYPIDKKITIKKLHKIFATYVVSLEVDEKDAINIFLLKGFSLDEFEADARIIDSLLKKQIIYQDEYFGKTIHKMERWAFDYFYTYKLSK